MSTPKHAIPVMYHYQASKEVTYNEAMYVLDFFANPSVLDRDLTAPPGSPADGDAYIVASGATGAWLGEDDNIAHRWGNKWNFYPPFKGLKVWVVDEAKWIFYTTAWVNVTVSGLVEFIVKTDTGDPSGYDGLVCINEYDNTIKMYGDGGWRSLGSW